MQNSPRGSGQRERERENLKTQSGLCHSPVSAPTLLHGFSLSSGLKHNPLPQGAVDHSSLGQACCISRPFAGGPSSWGALLTSTLLSLLETGGSRSDQGPNGCKPTTCVWSKNDLPCTLVGMWIATTLREARGTPFLKIRVM